MTSKLAVTSLVLGILALPTSLVCVGLFLAIPAVICGHKALRRIHSEAQLTGHGLAMGGLLAGYLSLALCVLIMPAVVIPNLLKARKTALRSQCKSNLERIVKAKQQWAAEDAKSIMTTPTADELSKYLGIEFLDVRCPEGGVYDIRRISENPTCTVKDHSL